MKRLSEVWRRWESAIRAGRAPEIHPELQRLAAAGRIGRADRVKIATFAYRAGLPLVGLRLLTRAVRASRRPVPPATVREKAVYAACLLKIGATAEAVALLDSIAHEGDPLVLFLTAAARITEWRYAEAIPLLEKYVAGRGVTGYEALVGRVNLFAAAVYCRRFEQARALLRGLLQDTSLRKLALLHGNTLEIAAQYHLEKGDFAEAERYLDRAEALFASRETVDCFIVRKWRALVAYRRDGDRAALESLRAEAVDRGHWETYRECDRIEAVYGGAEAPLWRAYFGTPHAAYRERLLARYRSAVGPATPASSYWLVMGGNEVPSSARLDLVGKRTDGTRIPALVKRFLLTLARDRYAPSRIPALFGKLFPGEVFSEQTSLLRVHQAARRTRHWLRNAGLPLELVEVGGSYRLSATGPIRIQVPGTEALDAALPLEARLWDATQGDAFAIRMVEPRLGLTRRTLQRELDRLVTRGTLTRAGRGPATRYLWPKARRPA